MRIGQALKRIDGIREPRTVDLDRATLADWIGRIAWLVRPLADRIGEHVMAGGVIHADDTPIPVLAPGNGKTKTGRLWVYLRDERPHAGPVPPAVLYRYTPDRKGEHCRAHDLALEIRKTYSLPAYTFFKKVQFLQWRHARPHLPDRPQPPAAAG